MTTASEELTADGLTGANAPAPTLEDIRALEPETSSARIIPLDTVGDSSDPQQGGASGEEVIPNSSGAVSTAAAGRGLDDADLARYADQSSFEDALLLYAKDGKSVGKPPPAWNVWQTHANTIAKLFPETREFRGKTEYFAEMRDLTMSEVYGPAYKKKMKVRPVS